MIRPELKEQFDANKNDNKIFVYIKGTPTFPQCGASGQMCNLLKHYGVEFGYFNVLSDEEVRQSIKEYADWPTFPMMFLNGELFGDFDIAFEYHERGQLKEMLAAS